MSKAENYFSDSALFTAEITQGKPTASARSSAVTYKLTCKKCQAETTRRGNSSALLKCGSCKRVWNTEDNSIIEVGGPAVAEAPEVVPEVIPEAAPEVVAKVLPKVKRDASHYVNIIRNATAAPAPKAPVEEQHYVIDILDHYDTRRAGVWTRAYYCAWYGSDELTFVLEEDFVDTAQIEKYEDSLPEEERFTSKFKNPRLEYKRKIVRTKEDVLNDAAEKSAVVEAPAENVIVNNAEETITIVITKRITLKKGEPFTLPDGFTYEYV